MLLIELTNDIQIELPPIPPDNTFDENGDPVFYGLRFLAIGKKENYLSVEFFPSDITSTFNISRSQVNQFMADMKKKLDSYNSDPIMFFENSLFTLFFLIHPVEINVIDLKSVETLWSMEPKDEK